jgi:hypothetical protein
MMKLMREWGFPAGLGTLWVIAVIYTLHAVSGLPHSVRTRTPASPKANVSDSSSRS